MTNFREKYIDLFKFNEGLRKIIEPILDSHPEPKNFKQFFLLYALAKSYKTQAAILLLSEKGFGQDAGILSRSIFELAITALYIVKDNTGKIAERFLNYDWIMRAEMYNRVSKDKLCKKNLKNNDPKGIIIKEVLRKAEEIKETYPNIEKKINWSDKTFKQMAKKIGRLDAYEKAYYLLCNLSHPNSRNMNDYLTDELGEGLEVNVGPDDKWIPQSLVATFDFFYNIVEAWNKEFNLGLEDKLKKIAKQYLKKIREINKKNKTPQNIPK